MKIKTFNKYVLIRKIDPPVSNDKHILLPKDIYGFAWGEVCADFKTFIVGVGDIILQKGDMVAYKITKHQEGEGPDVLVDNELLFLIPYNDLGLIVEKLK